MSREKEKNRPEKPDIFSYHDYRLYLKDRLNYLKQTKPGFSLRTLSKESKLALGYLSMVLNDKRGLSADSASKLMKPLALSNQEAVYFELLRTIAESDSQEVRLNAFERIQKFKSYQTQNQKEVEVYKYLTHWFYVALREMALLPDFKVDPVWIQQNLQFKVSLKEIEEALKFLLEREYLVMQKGKIPVQKDKDINCVGGVYRLAIVKFHNEMLNLAGEALHKLPLDERIALSHTMAVSETDYDAIQKILNEALQKVSTLGKKEVKKERVYQVSLAAFPLTRKDSRRLT